MRLQLWAMAALALLATGCPEERIYDPFDGSAWPDRRPRLAMPDSGAPAALISDNGSDTISVVDLAGPTLIGRYPVGFSPLDVDGPHHLAVDPISRSIYSAYAYPPPVEAPGPHGSHGLGTVDGILVRLSLDDLRVLATADTEANPGDVVMTPEGGRVLVSHFDLSRALQPPGDAGPEARYSSVMVYEAPTLRLLARVRVCPAAHGMAVSPDGRTAYVACYGSDELAIIALDDPNFAVRRLPVGPSPGTIPAPRYGPYAATISPDGARVYVSDLEGHDLRTYDVAAGRFDDARVVALRGAVTFPAFGPGGATLIVPTQAPDGLALVRTDTMEVVRARTFTRLQCQSPHQAARAPDGTYVLVCEGDHRGPGTLLRFDPETLETSEPVQLGVFPDSVVFAGGH